MSHEHWEHISAVISDSRKKKKKDFPLLCPLTGGSEVRVSYNLAVAEDHADSLIR